MSDVVNIIALARKKLDADNATEALKVLKPLRKSLKSKNASNLELLQVFSDVYLELGEAEKAYPLLVKSCQLDSDGSKGGSEKFFVLGQIIGGEEGSRIMFQGIENISKVAGDVLDQEQIKKIVNGLLSIIEIWMTDLCMEPNAETQCEELIQKAMDISEKQSPEAWAVLGSIRISQQRYKDACDAFTEAWRLYEQKKQAIEARLQEADLSVHRDYIDLMEPLLSLLKMCIEMGLYEISLQITSAVKELNEDNLQNYYLEGFTYYLIAKLETFKLSNPNVVVNVENIYEFNEHFQEVSLDLSNNSLAETLHEARVALSFAVKIGENTNPIDEVSQELVEGAKGLLREIGGPVTIEELMRIKKGEAVEEADLELDIEEESD